MKKGNSQEMHNVCNRLETGTSSENHFKWDSGGAVLGGDCQMTSDQTLESVAKIFY